MKEKKCVNVEVDIKFGKYIKNTGFDVYSDGNNLICVGMWIGEERQHLSTQLDYFSNHYKEIKKAWFKLYGEIA